ncbi:hypothetical protein FO519_006425 [Halicephalobus sp. NKZ332]|nr:hypothetical protein FO519_006425 [Halicephalobus sp. NKZ332]
MIFKTIIFAILTGLVVGIELPPGLRPAKALGEPDKPIIPGVNEPHEETPSNVRTPPNLSLRSRMIAALNSPVPEKPELRRHPTADEVAAAAAKAPLVFQKNPKKHLTKAPKPVTRVTQIPPAGKNYGVNTIVQTNLVDANGRIMKGVNVVPIPIGPVPATPKPRGSARRVEAEDDKVVPIQFGSRSSLI